MKRPGAPPAPGPPRRSPRRRPRGFAYATLLALVALLTAVALAFLDEVFSKTSAGMAREREMAASYLAEAAAAHARWRILHEPTFPAREDVYYRHDLGEGRYGYRVKRPTATTFGAVSVFGVVPGDHVTRHDQLLRILSRVGAVYGSSASNWTQHLRLVGARWDPAKNAVNLASKELHWAEMEGSPTRREAVVAFLDGSRAVNLSVWNGRTWSVAMLFGTALSGTYPAFDVAYETSTGNALVLGPGPTNDDVSYTTWNGGAWSPWPAAFAFSTWGWSDIRYVTADPNPVKGGVMIGVLDKDKDIYLFRWSGAAFSYLGLLENNTTKEWGRLVAIKHESLSGDALIVWANNDATWRSRTYDGAYFSYAQMLPDIGSKARLIKLAADPTSDQILAAAADEADDLNITLWSGSSWSERRELETDMTQNGDRTRETFDLAWDPSGTAATVVWQKSGTYRVQYVRWVKGTALSTPTIRAGPDMPSRPQAMRLLAVPGTDHLVLLVVNEGYGLRYAFWDGRSFVPDPMILLEPYMSWNEDLPFALAAVRP